jgi:4a-hydroxytetrahydrobiopterin dehydratase
MAEKLTAKTCTPCRGGIPPLTVEEAAGFMPEAPGWDLVADATRIERTYRFADFGEALDFVGKVGELAEAQGHHPEACFGWGFCTVTLQTKKIKGLHENDFIMAAKINALAGA